MNKNLKELEIILSDFACNKNCPYCTAKITRWPVVEDDIDMLEYKVNALKHQGYSFHFVTIGGNGEPSLHDINKLRHIINIFNDWNIPVKRILTSGNIFTDKEKDKFEIFNDAGYYFEVTVSSLDSVRDMKTLGYSNDYLHSEQFKKAKHIRLNYVLTNDNINSYIEEIKGYIDSYPNIDTVALKILNINTRTGLIDNKYSEWIVKNAVQKSDSLRIKEELDKEFEYSHKDFGAYYWKYKNKNIYFSFKDSDPETNREEHYANDLVWYGNKFVNYDLEDVLFEDSIKQVYFAQHFYRTNLPNGSFHLEKDARDALLKECNSGLMNYKPDCFLKLHNGKVIHYIGPFYNEKASYGDLTSTDCQEVVQTERKLVDMCDVFVCFINEHTGAGVISELIYAAMQNKEIVVIYRLEESITYKLKTSNWFPIIFANNIQQGKIKIMSVNSDDELKEKYLSLNI